MQENNNTISYIDGDNVKVDNLLEFTNLGIDSMLNKLGVPEIMIGEASKCRYTTLALAKLLRFYYDKCIGLEIKLRYQEEKNLLDNIIKH